MITTTVALTHVFKENLGQSHLSNPITQQTLQVVHINSVTNVLIYCNQALMFISQPVSETYNIGIRYT